MINCCSQHVCVDISVCTIGVRDIYRDARVRIVHEYATSHPVNIQRVKTTNREAEYWPLRTAAPFLYFVNTLLNRSSLIYHDASTAFCSCYSLAPLLLSLADLRWERLSSRGPIPGMSESLGLGCTPNSSCCNTNLSSRSVTLNFRRPVYGSLPSCSRSCIPTRRRLLNLVLGNGVRW